MTEYQEYLEKKRREHGEKFDPSDLAPEFAVYFRGPRVKVQMSYGEVKFGRVSVTTGWRPVFLLMKDKRSYGSSITLGAKDHIVAIQQHDGKYIPVSR